MKEFCNFQESLIVHICEDGKHGTSSYLEDN